MWTYWRSILTEHQSAAQSILLHWSRGKTVVGQPISKRVLWLVLLSFWLMLNTQFVTWYERSQRSITWFTVTDKIQRKTVSCVENLQEWSEFVALQGQTLLGFWKQQTMNITEKLHQSNEGETPGSTTETTKCVRYKSLRVESLLQFSLITDRIWKVRNNETSLLTLKLSVWNFMRKLNKTCFNECLWMNVSTKC